MYYAIEPETDKVQIRLTELGKKRYKKALSKPAVSRLEGPAPDTVEPDARGYYEMDFWLFLRVFGGTSFISALTFRLYVIGNVHVVIKPGVIAPVVYPG